MIHNLLLIFSQYKYIIQQNALQNKQYHEIDFVHFDNEHFAIINRIYKPMIYRLDFLMDDFKPYYLRTEGLSHKLITMPSLFNIDIAVLHINFLEPRMDEIKNAEVMKDLLTWINYPKGIRANAFPVL